MSNSKTNVINFVNSLRVTPCHYRLSKHTDCTIYSSIFALFIYDLLDELSSWTKPEKEMWIDYINSFQDKESGLFFPQHFSQIDIYSKANLQLTSFCLSALFLLEGMPKYDLRFIEGWRTKENVNEYLRKHGCWEGKLGSGNFAMFLGIFLTYSHESNNSSQMMEMINAWFEHHDKYQNRHTGFWGKRTINKYFWGFQNAFHQFVIYDYWNRPILYYDKAVDTILKLQDRDGLFAMSPGGGGCWDYDAIHLLVILGLKNDYRREAIKESLLHAYRSLVASQNTDGGFCESRMRPNSIIQSINNWPFYFTGDNPYVWWSRFKTTSIISLKKELFIKNQWTSIGHAWHESDLWNTWFRLLAICEIEISIKLKTRLIENCNFHKFIGLGFFNTKE